MADRSGSILAADFGNVTTRVTLIDLVDGVYRMVARGETSSTIGFPLNDVRVGLQRAVEQITAVSGRRLMTPAGQVISPEQPDRSGVDYFIATASTARSLRTVLVGLVPELSIASGQRAAAGTYVEILETLSLADARSEEDQLNALISSYPDLVFIVGGVEGGARDAILRLARVVRLSVQLVEGGHRPVVLYAGNSALVPEISAMFEGLTTLLIAPNIRPELDVEELESAQLQLALAFNEQQSRHGGYGTLGEMTSLGVLPTAQSYDLITNFLMQSLKANVLTVDIGSAVSTLSAAVDGKVTTTIRTDIGVGHSAETLRNLAGDAMIEAWLPFTSGTNQLRHYALNKTLRPFAVPETLRGLYFEHALLRASVETLILASRPVWSSRLNPSTGNHLMPSFDWIIGAGASLTRTGNPGYNALLLIDAVQPTGITRLHSDPYALVAALGALAHVIPEAVVQVLDSGGLERLGVCFSLSGVPTTGKTALRVKIITEDGMLVKQDVPGGHLWRYPLGTGKQARVEVSVVGGGLHIGERNRLKTTVEGGSAGLIFDARGRPLPLAADPRGKANQIPLWISQMTGDALIQIGEDWLVASEEEGEAESVAQAQSEAERRLTAEARGAKPQRDGRRERRGRPGRDKDSSASAADDMPEMDMSISEEIERDTFSNELDELRRR